MFMVGEGLSRSSSRCVGLDLDRVDSPTGSTSSTVRPSLMLYTHSRSSDQVAPSGHASGTSCATVCLLFRVAVGCCASQGACACACVVEGCRVRIEACAHGGAISAAWDLCEAQGDSSSENETWRMRGPPGVKRMSGACPCFVLFCFVLSSPTCSTTRHPPAVGFAGLSGLRCCRFFIFRGSHSISFTRAQGFHKYKIDSPTPQCLECSPSCLCFVRRLEVM
jgi:hypothetical protein